MDSGTDVTYNEAVAFQGDMNLRVNNATFDIEATTPESDEKSEEKSFAADFIADAPDVPAGAQSVNRAVFMRNKSGNPSACHLQNATINVGASGTSGDHNEAIGIDGAGNLNVINGTINIVTGGSVDRDTEDVQE